MNNDLMQKLVVAKQIMDVHNQKPRGNQLSSPSTPNLASYNAVPATYNIPQEFLAEQPKPKTPTTQLPTQDRIMNSKLPDEIKRLMLEHPIEQPKMAGTETILSDELVEAASRLMNTDASGKQIRQSSPQKQTQVQNFSENMLDTSNLRNLLKEVVREVLSEQGVITESSQKTKEQITFRVGQHVFEGVITKIKKVK